MILRLSAKLAKRIGVNPAASLSPDVNPFADWSAHVFTADRRRYIIMTNTASLYTVLMAGKGVTTDATLLSQFTSGIQKLLTDDGLGGVFDEFIAPALSDVSYSTALNRGVTGSMNDLIKAAKSALFRPDSPLPEISRHLNSTPMTYIRTDSTHDLPRRVLVRLYDQLSDDAGEDTPADAQLGRKMSEMVLEFAGPFINVAETVEQKHARLMAACTAWNLACSPPDKRTEFLDEYLESYGNSYPDTTQDDLAAIREDMETLIQEKLRLFPNVNKQIVNAQVTRTPEGDRIDIASIRHV